MSVNVDKILLECGILEKLKQNSHKYNNVKDSKNILAIYEQHIFVWHDAGSCILTTEIKNNEFDEKIKKITNTNHSVSPKDYYYKILTLTNPPVFEVESLNFNQTGNLLSLSGKLGVTIYEVPWRYGTFGTSNVNEIIGRSWFISELFSICPNRVQVVHVAWHPGSLSNTHITVLATDNCIRIYNVNNPQTPEQEIYLGSNTRTSYLSSDAKISFSSCYGENAVSFDFGPPETMEVAKSSLISASKEFETKTVWPIFLLHGNGDIYVLKAPLKKERLKSIYKLEGPLAMYPPAEDNYGYDACAILCLHSTPISLVIATATGMIYHCLVLENTKEKSLYSGMPEPTSDECDESLYVFESVELPLTLTEDQDDDTYANSIRLYKDVISNCKYCCTHVAGLHTVAIPFLQALLESFDTDRLQQLLSNQQKQPCIVEHILCTKPFSQMKAVPVLGLDCTVIDGGIVLVCLLASWEFISLSMVSSFLPPIPHLLTKDSPPLKEDNINNTNFEQSLEKALQRSLCSPFVKSFPIDKGKTFPQQWLDLLCNVTQRYREDYIQRLTTAHTLLKSRIKVLTQQKEYQLNDIKRCEKEKENLKSGIERLTKKYEDVQANQQILQKRIENIMKKVPFHFSSLSRAEIDMKQTLLSYNDKIKIFEGSLDLIKKKISFRKVKMEEFDILPNENDVKNVSFNETQMKHVKELLSQEGESIADIIKQVNLLKKQMRLA